MSNESIKNTISLLLITLVAGLLLGAVYEITKEPIKKEQQRAKEEAYKAVFADASSFENVDLNVEEVKGVLSEKGYAATIHEVMSVSDASGKKIGEMVAVIITDLMYIQATILRIGASQKVYLNITMDFMV